MLCRCYRGENRSVQYMDMVRREPTSLMLISVTTMATITSEVAKSFAAPMPNDVAVANMLSEKMMPFIVRAPLFRWTFSFFVIPTVGP